MDDRRSLGIVMVVLWIGVIVVGAALVCTYWWAFHGAGLIGLAVAPLRTGRQLARRAPDLTIRVSWLIAAAVIVGLFGARQILDGFNVGNSYSATRWWFSTLLIVLGLWLVVAAVTALTAIPACRRDDAPAGSSPPTSTSR